MLELSAAFRYLYFCPNEMLPCHVAVKFRLAHALWLVFSRSLMWLRNDHTMTEFCATRDKWDLYFTLLLHDLLDMTSSLCVTLTVQKQSVCSVAVILIVLFSLLCPLSALVTSMKTHLVQLTDVLWLYLLLLTLSVITFKHQYIINLTARLLTAVQTKPQITEEQIQPGQILSH